MFWQWGSTCNQDFSFTFSVKDRWLKPPNSCMLVSCPPNLFFLASLQLFFSCRILSIVAWFLLISPNSHSFKTPISGPALVSLLIPPLTLPTPILLGFHTRVRPHFSVSKIRRVVQNFSVKFWKLYEWNSCLHFACISFDFFSPVCTEQKRTTLQGNPNFLKKFYLDVSSHWLIVLVWSNISHFQNSTVFRFIGKLSHKIFQALTLVDILESFLP